MPRPPNILITGTPGTGKSSLAELVMHHFDGLTHLNISEVIKERKLADRFNEEWQTWEFDDDKVSLSPLFDKPPDTTTEFVLLTLLLGPG